MKKTVLSLALASFAVGTILAGEPVFTGFKSKAINAPAVVKKPLVLPGTIPAADASRGARALDKIDLSTAGNLYTVLNSACNQIYASDSLNSVVFIHRSDIPPATCCPGSNIAQYRFDISKNGGTSWTSNIGTLNPAANNTDYSSRYPQTSIYRAPGVTNVDSAYMAYSGTWHNGAANAIWYGEAHGAAQLSGNPATFKSRRDTLNNGNIVPGYSFTQGASGKFFNLNYDYRDLGNNISWIGGIIMQRGVWVDSLKDVQWSSQIIPMQFDSFFDANGAFQGSVVGSPVVAFDPTGQKGWLVFKADMNHDQRHLESLWFMQSSDYGDTWSAPAEIDLSAVSGMFDLPLFSVNGVDVGAGHTLQGDIDIAVDYNGDVHIGCIVAVGDTADAQYSYYPGQGMFAYDIYSSGTTSCWKGHLFRRVFAVQGQYTVAQGTDAAVNEGNRFQAAHTEDGKRIFFFWNDTDSALVAAQSSTTNNVSPNLYGVGVDVTTKKTTTFYNFTVGDPEFGGQDNSHSEGTVGGSLFPVVSTTAFTRTNSYNVPVVLTQPDYNNTGSNKLGGNPAKFFYCRNIDFPQSAFTINLDNSKPTLTLIGADTVYARVNNVYTDSGAVAFKCGEVLPSPTYSGNVNKDSIGQYLVTWTVQDANGNQAQVTRVVIISDVPVARIWYRQNWGNNFQFRDSSLNFPTARTWKWGDGTGKTGVTVFTKSYNAAGQKMVTLAVSNQFGADNDTVYVNVALGIEDPEFANAVRVAPIPSSGVFFVEAPEEAELSVTVYDVAGKAVATKMAGVKSSANNTRFDLGFLSNGAYLLKVESGKLMTVKPITIVK
ncbi:MAG: DUF5011 domain-containing protein [Chitinophagales bacterium]